MQNPLSKGIDKINFILILLENVYFLCHTALDAARNACLLHCHTALDAVSPDVCDNIRRCRVKHGKTVKEYF